MGCELYLSYFHYSLGDIQTSAGKEAYDASLLCRTDKQSRFTLNTNTL